MFKHEFAFGVGFFLISIGCALTAHPDLTVAFALAAGFFGGKTVKEFLDG